MTPEQRSLRASIAAHVQWAKESDPPARTAGARQAFLERFEREADPDGVLDPAERAPPRRALPTGVLQAARAGVQPCPQEGRGR
jgi:hypothetical protein